MNGADSREISEAGGLAGGPDSPTSADQVELASGGASAALDLYGVLSAAPGNLFFSPFSLRQALAMVYAGARGSTAEELARALRFTLPEDRIHAAFKAFEQGLASRIEPTPEVTLQIANSLWGQRGVGFQGAFLERLSGSYGAGLREVDFQADSEQARVQINAWAARQTNDRIQGLIPPGVLNAGSRLVLANAVYFKALWQFPFAAERTRKGAFTRLDGTKVDVDMMSGAGQVRLAYARGEGFQAVELPYVGRDLAILIILPDAGRFEAVEARLVESGLEGVLRQLAGRQVSVVMPRFQISAGFQLSGALRRLGVRAAFDPGLADFSGMTGERDLFISDVFHKAFLDVDEEGTEAAAATAVLMQVTAMPEPGLNLVLDRPFLFAIREVRTGVVFFLGRIVNPNG